MSITVHCDTSYSNGLCCTGYIVDIDGEVIKGYSDVFYCPNNNEAEIQGIILSCAIALDNIPVAYFRSNVDVHVFNDSIVATTVTDHRYKPTNKAKKKFDIHDDIVAWAVINKVTLHCNRKKRNSPLIKECDKLSKLYRKGGKKC